MFIDADADTTYAFDSFTGAVHPGEFTYGNFSMTGERDETYYYLSEGLGVPLSLLRDSCEVKMIVPFQLGSYFSQENYMPVYYERVRYIFEK